MQAGLAKKNKEKEEPEAGRMDVYRDIDFDREIEGTSSKYTTSNCRPMEKTTLS